jgi:excisionase family DNA binding protein
VSDNEYLTPAEAAIIMRVTRRTMYVWLKQGRLKALKIGNSWRIPRESVMPQYHDRIKQPLGGW